MRRGHLRGHANSLKRVLVHTGGFNLGLLMRRLIGVGTPRSLQGRLATRLGARLDLRRRLWGRLPDHGVSDPPDSSVATLLTRRHEDQTIDLQTGAFTTGC